MKAFHNFSSLDWKKYLGSTMFYNLKLKYKTNKAIAMAFQTPFNFWACKAITGLHVSKCRFCLVCWENKMADLMLVKEHLK